MNIEILVVEDDLKIARLLELELIHAGYRATCIHDGLSALKLIENQSFDLIILDLMLPGIDGIKVMTELRTVNRDIPVIMLTAKGLIGEKIKGLDSGANDYIVKPFEMEELLARIRVLLRNVRLTEKEKIGEIEINFCERSVIKNDSEVSLSEKEFELLRYFLRNKNMVLTREQILNGVWGYDFEGEFKIVDVYVGYLRKKLQLPQLTTVRGSGYVWKG
jgi:DNA-binding response OmpR family regulator